MAIARTFFINKLLRRDDENAYYTKVFMQEHLGQQQQEKKYLKNDKQKKMMQICKMLKYTHNEMFEAFLVLLFRRQHQHQRFIKQPKWRNKK